MATETLNYKFIKDDPNEDYDVARVNANLDKIDAEIKAVDDKVEAVEQSIGNIKIPVKSVNGKTGEVELTAGDVGAETPEGASSKANAAASAALGAANQYTNQEVGKVSTQMAESAQVLDNHIGKGGTVHALATTSMHGFMSKDDKTALGNKVDKPASAVINNIAIFNPAKNVIDSGKNLTEFAQIITGSYPGNASAKTIVVGVTPKLVAIWNSAEMFFVTTNFLIKVSGSSDTAYKIVSNGFNVGINAGTANGNGQTYNYAAFI